jgi:hypothetical protein
VKSKRTNPVRAKSKRTFGDKGRRMPTEIPMDGDVRVRKRFFWTPFDYGRKRYWLESAWAVERYIGPCTDSYGGYSSGGWRAVRIAEPEEVARGTVLK